MVYVLNRFGQISNVLTGNKCASGTGEFFLQQLRRMDVTLEEAARWAADNRTRIPSPDVVRFFASPIVPMPPIKVFLNQKSPPASAE